LGDCTEHASTSRIPSCPLCAASNYVGIDPNMHIRIALRFIARLLSALQEVGLALSRLEPRDLFTDVWFHSQFNAAKGAQISLSIGLAHGPLHLGLVGQSRYVFDVVGQVLSPPALYGALSSHVCACVYVCVCAARWFCAISFLLCF
jgi:hypothetical protein